MIFVFLVKLVTTGVCLDLEDFFLLIGVYHFGRFSVLHRSWGQTDHESTIRPS